MVEKIKKINNRSMRLLAFILLDMIIVSYAFFYGTKFILKQDFFQMDDDVVILVIACAITIITMFFFSLYNLILEFVGFSEVFRTLLATLVINIITFVVFKIFKIGNYSVHFFLLIIPLEFLFFTVVRFAKRVLLSLRVLLRKPKKTQAHLINTLVIGAGSGGKLVLEDVTKNVRLKNKIVAFVDDDPDKIKKRLNNIPILGPISNSLEYVQKYNIEEVIIGIANISRKRLLEILSLFEKAHVKMKRLPLMTEIVSDENMRIVDVNIDDLLIRDIITLDNAGISDLIKDKDVLVTGGGGSIGSELCKQILNYNPKHLIIFDIYENTTYEVQLELKKRIDDEKRPTKLIVLIGSVYNEKRLEDVFKTYKPNIVFHAAAYKHVPLMEDSAVEAVRTNVLGTYNVAKLSSKYGVIKMVLVSTDKAVRPTNVMGATKSCCEKIIEYFDANSKTSYAAVRFGNVLGSNGSVVPLFKKQIACGGPVTVTDKRITRYFMTISEAVNLILQSAVYANGGEIFILDMGEPVKIYDLAERMIRLYGLVPNEDIMIVETGLRPGEKLYEELLVNKGVHQKTQNDKIFIEKRNEIVDVESFIKVIKEQFEVVSNHKVKELVQNIVTTYIIDDHTAN